VVIKLGLSEPSNTRAPYRTGVIDSVCTLLSTAGGITDRVQRQSVCRCGADGVAATFPLVRDFRQKFWHAVCTSG